MADSPELSYNLDDPSVLGYPASPITAAGDDPDEIAAMRGTRPQFPDAGQVARQSTSARSAGSTGGAGVSPAPLPPSQNAAQPTQPGNSFDDFSKQAMTQELTAGNKLMATGDQLQDDPRITQAQNQVAADEAAKPDPHDPNYKPSFGRRVLRGLRGAGLGFAEHGLFGAAAGAIDPALVPGGKNYNAPTDAYDTAVQANQRKTSQDQQTANNLAENFKRSADLLKERGTVYNEAGQRLGETVTGANNAADLPNKTTTANADLMKAQAEAAKVALETPEAKDAATQKLIASRTNSANADPTLRKPGYLRTRYILTGEIQAQPDLNSAMVEEQQVRNLTQAWMAKPENAGKKPGFEDLQQIYVAAKASPTSGNQEQVNLRRASTNAENLLKTLMAQKSAKTYLLATDEEKKALESQIAEAQMEVEDLQRQLAPASATPRTAQPATSTPQAAGPPPPPPGAAVRLQVPPDAQHPQGRIIRFEASNTEGIKKAMQLGAVPFPAAPTPRPQ